MDVKGAEIGGLYQIVLEMLANGVPDNEILVNLQQSGLTKEGAAEVLRKAKSGFEDLSGKKLDRLIEERFSQKLASKLDKLQKDMALQSDLKFMEHKKYTDKKVEQVLIEIGSLKSDITDMRVKTESAVKGTLREMDTLKVSGSTQRYLSVALIVGGLISCVLFYIYVPYFIDYLTMKEPVDMYAMLNALFLVLFALLAFVCFTLSKRVYSKSKKPMAEISPWFGEDQQKPFS